MKNLCSGVLLVCIGLILGCSSTQHTNKPPSAELLQSLKRGVNIAHWFEHRTVGQHFDIPTDSELQELRRAGIAHIRIALDPEFVSKHEMNPPAVSELHDSIVRLQHLGFTVIITLQPDSTWKKSLIMGARLDEYLNFLGLVATQFKDLPTQQFALELLNEPILDTPWQHIYPQLVTKAREVLPEHTLVLSGGQWSDIPDLVKLMPLKDKNIIYSFHFYEPKNFTHQGASWGWPPWRHFRNFPYPATEENIAAHKAEQNSLALSHFEQYAIEAWNRAALETEINKAVQWGKLHNVPIWCNEFGAYRYFTKDEYRQQWLSDTREILEQHNIGWTLWSWRGGFGIVENGVWNPQTAASLGLSPQ